jgi:hypothetical protein
MYGSKAKRVDTKFSRKGKNITILDTNTTSQYESINKAKKESRKLQESNGGLGMGSLTLLG